jgi:hypothetical protein
VSDQQLDSRLLNKLETTQIVNHSAEVSTIYSKDFRNRTVEASPKSQFRIKKQVHTNPLSPTDTHVKRSMNHTHTSFRKSFQKNLNKSVNFGDDFRGSPPTYYHGQSGYQTVQMVRNQNNLSNQGRTISYNGIYQNSYKPKGGAPCNKDMYGLPATLKSLKILNKLNLPP